MRDQLFETQWTAACQASLSIPTPRVYSNSCLLNGWCHPTISSSVFPFSTCLQSFPASGSFPTSWLFASGGQSTGASASASVLPMNIQDWFRLGLTGLILLSKGLSRVFSHTAVWKHQFFGAQPSVVVLEFTDLLIKCLFIFIWLHWVLVASGGIFHWGTSVL